MRMSRTGSLRPPTSTRMVSPSVTSISVTGLVDALRPDLTIEAIAIEWLRSDWRPVNGECHQAQRKNQNAHRGRHASPPSGSSPCSIFVLRRTRWATYYRRAEALRRTVVAKTEPSVRLDIALSTKRQSRQCCFGKWVGVYGQQPLTRHSLLYDGWQWCSESLSQLPVRQGEAHMTSEDSSRVPARCQTTFRAATRCRR